MPFGREIGLGPSDIVLDGNPAPPTQMLDGAQLSLSKGAQPPQFSAHVYCGQTAGWIKIPLGMEVGLDPGHIMLDGDPAPRPPKQA